MESQNERAVDAILVSPKTLAWLRAEWRAGRWLQLQDAPLEVYLGIEDGVLVPAYRTDRAWVGVVKHIMAGYRDVSHDAKIE